MKALLPNLSRTEAATEIFLASSILLDQSYANHITTVRKIIEDTLVIDGDTVKVKEWEKGETERERVRTYLLYITYLTDKRCEFTRG